MCRVKGANRLVKVRSSVDTDVTYQTANFDGLGRRIRKDVANSGDLDGTTVFYYDGQKIIETRDGSGNLVSQFVRGLRYIDEVVMVRVKDEGELYVHQDANWNVVGLTDLGGRLVERYVYRPYGEVIVHQLGGYADYDGDGDVDANDRGEITGLTCGGSNPSGACRVLDLDFDNDCDAGDETVFDSLPHTGTVVHPARRSSLLGQPFAHQGLFLDSEIASYQNRARQYGPGLRRFVQRDPLGVCVETPDIGPRPHIPERCFIPPPCTPRTDLYPYVGGDPLDNVDPLGWAIVRCGTVRCYCPSTMQPPTDVLIRISRTSGQSHTGWVTGRIYLRTPDCFEMLDEDAVLPDSKLDMDATIQHECMHTCQVKHYGWLYFTAGYAANWLFCGGDWGCNNWEKDADYWDDITRHYEWVEKPSGCWEEWD
jgi:RHS repeat-associated protein